jgi:ketosteroid isomerase-like protein
MRRPLTAFLLAAAIAGLGACGESDQEQAREVVQDYAEARESQDFERICDLYSEEFTASLGTEDCPAFVQEQSAGADGTETVEVVDVQVKGDTATADLDVSGEAQEESRVRVLLKREDDDWRISALQ